MKLFNSAWEAEDGSLHKTEEEADRHEQKTRIAAAIRDWGRDRQTEAVYMSDTIARFLYERGVRFPAE